MINVIAAKGLDGLIAASYMHKEAKEMRGGIYVSYVHNDASNEVLGLMASIELAGSIGVRLPMERKIVLYGVSLRPGVRQTLERFLESHPDVSLVEMANIPLRKPRLLFLRAIVCVFRLIHGDDTAPALAKYI